MNFTYFAIVVINFSQSFRLVTSFYRKLRHDPFVEHRRFTVQVFSVFTVYFSTNLELCFSFKGYRNTQVVEKVCFLCVYALPTSMISFEISLATLPMETNVAFCAQTCFFVFFAHFTSTLRCYRSKEVVYLIEGLPHSIEAYINQNCFIKVITFIPVWKSFIPS